MCGLPFSRRDAAADAVAAPVPSPRATGAGRSTAPTSSSPLDSPHRSLEDTFGGVVGYTLADSMSGAVALRDYLLPLARRGRAALPRRVGGLVNARGVIDALAAGRIDVGPLDSFSHDLLKRYDPARRARRCAPSASTVMRPIPPLVATAPIAPDALARLRDASSARVVQASSPRRWRACSSRASPSPIPPTTTCSPPSPIAPCLPSRTSE